MRDCFIHIFVKKSIGQIKDLIDVNTTASLCLNWNSAKHKFNLKPNDFMSWTSILEAISATWKKELKENELSSAECQEIPSSALSVKATYWRLLGQLLESQLLRKLLAGF